jgi:PAS domain-containing protein
MGRIVKKNLKSGLFVTLLTILAIDAFRTLFESIYFGAWYTSLVGFIPKSIHEALVRPENVFIPKMINIIAAVLVILIVLRRWIPGEEAERAKEARHRERLEREIQERKLAQSLLAESEKRLIEAQKLAKVGHYVLDFQSGYWTSSVELDILFGIKADYKKDIEGWAGLVHPDHRDIMCEYLKTEVLGNHQKFDREYKIINSEKQKEIWVHGTGNLKFDESGQLIEMFGTIQDITERKILIMELQAALEDIKVLKGLVPICSSCKKIRDDKGYWNQLESFIEEHSGASFSHSICPECSEKLYGDQGWFLGMKGKKNL